LIPCYALQMGIIIIILHHPPSRTSRTSNKCIRIPKNMSFKKKNWTFQAPHQNSPGSGGQASAAQRCPCTWTGDEVSFLVVGA
jgi:hypothetical protein